MSWSFNIPFNVEKQIMTLNGLFGGVPAADNTIDIVDNESTYILGRCAIFCKSIVATKVASMKASALQIESADDQYDALTYAEFPLCTSMKNRAFFFRKKIETIKLPLLNDVSDSIYWFYSCSSLKNVYLNSMQSSTAFSTSSSSGGFPWGAPRTCIFHFSDGDFDGNKNPV